MRETFYSKAGVENWDDLSTIDTSDLSISAQLKLIERHVQEEFVRIVFGADTGGENHGTRYIVMCYNACHDDVRRAEIVAACTVFHEVPALVKRVRAAVTRLGLTRMNRKEITQLRQELGFTG